MATLTPELQDILSTLDNLRTRVEVLSAGAEQEQAPAREAVSGPVPGQSAPVALSAGPDPDWTSMLLDGVNRLGNLREQREFVEFFSRLARKGGLRLLLLKRWTSGLQVYLEVGVKLPPEARRKRSDGRAPIPLAKGDIFAAVAEETAVYAGPVPARNFPLDLTLMLGRGTKDRGIIILPLPSQGHWNTYLYLDGDEDMSFSLAMAEVLARHALARMYLLEKGVHLREGRVDAILKAELARRGQVRRHQVVRVEPPRSGPSSSEVSEPVPAKAAPGPDSRSGPETPTAIAGVDPFAVVAKAVGTPSENSEPPVPGAGAGEVRAFRGGDEPRTATPGDAGEQKQLRPEDILHHSGELPALPKAACHIMAVIEDPKTTATRLEKALAMDQALTAKVLRIANSPFYGAVREIKTVSESIVRLGFVAIRNWTLVTAARSVFLAPGAGVLYRKIWQQSVMSAMAGQLVAQAAGLRDPESVFIGGLMQNIGQLVLARSYPEFFQEILLESTSTGKPYHVIERNLLGYDHGELGALLIREWNLSADLEDAVRWHHRFDDPRARNARIAAMIALGEEIAWCSGAADEGRDDGREDAAEETAQVSSAGRFLGFSAEKIAELTRRAASLKIDPHFFN